MPPIDLQYATPQMRRSWRERLQPRHLLWLAGITALVTLRLRLDIGSMVTVVNPLRFLGCVVAVTCVVNYALWRLQKEDAPGSHLRTVIFSGCVLVSTLAFVCAHWSVWGDHRKPRLGFHHVYWPAMFTYVGSIVLALACEGSCHIAKRRRHHRASGCW